MKLLGNIQDNKDIINKEYVKDMVISSDDSISDVLTVTSEEFDAMIQAGTIDPNTLYNVTNGKEQDKVVYNTVPVGTGVLWFGDLESVPSNFIVPDGSIVNISDYPDLFAIWGTKYGGNGTTTFGLPNLKGKVVVMMDQNDTDFNTIGGTGGAKTVTLTVEEMPKHTHNILDEFGQGLVGMRAGNGDGDGWDVYVGNSSTNWKHRRISAINGLSETGGGGAHNNLQPYIVAYYIIKAKKGVYTESLRRLDSEVDQMQKSEQEIEATFTITADYQYYNTYTSYPLGFNKDNTYVLGCKFKASNFNETLIRSVVEIIRDGTIKVVSDSCIIRLTDNVISIRGRAPFLLEEGPDITVKLLLKKFR